MIRVAPRRRENHRKKGRTPSGKSPM